MRTKVFTLFFIILSVTAQAQTDAFEDKALDTIFKLKEVKEMSAYIKKESKGKHRLVLFVNGTPSKETPYYWIKAWEDNGLTEVTVFDFFVYPKPVEIKFYDTIKDTAISLKEWRRQTKK